MRFSIERAYEHHAPAEAPPFHRPGGSWTFVDAKLPDGTRFGFGLDAAKRSSDFAPTKGMITVPDADDGRRLVEAAARAFGGKVPSEATHSPITSRPITIFVLGTDVRREPSGGFAGVGSWTATKAVLEKDGDYAELYLNFDLIAKEGELVQRDARQVGVTVAWLSELR